MLLSSTYRASGIIFSRSSSPPPSATNGPRRALNRGSKRQQVRNRAMVLTLIYIGHRVAFFCGRSEEEEEGEEENEEPLIIERRMQPWAEVSMI